MNPLIKWIFVCDCVDFSEIYSVIILWLLLYNTKWAPYMFWLSAIVLWVNSLFTSMALSVWCMAYWKWYTRTQSIAFAYTKKSQPQQKQKQRSKEISKIKKKKKLIKYWNEVTQIHSKYVLYFIIKNGAEFKFNYNLL